MSESKLPTGPLPEHIPAHFFRSLYDVTGRTWCGPTSRLAERMAAFPTRLGVTNKRILPCWSPYAPWGAPDAAMIGTLVLDIDEGTTVEEALDRCAGWALILHTSWSYQEDAPKFRVLLPLARPVPPKEWTARWEAATSAIGLSLDRTCKDPRRRYLLPAASAADAPRRSVVALDRPALDLLDVQLPTPDAPAARTSRPEIHVPARLRDQAVRARLRWDPDSRERAAAQLGAAVVGQGERRRAAGIVCPACSRPSVWFYVAPAHLRRARCNHRESCGWAGGLEELLVGRAA
jgi:hypothetical protein